MKNLKGITVIDAAQAKEIKGGDVPFTVLVNNGCGPLLPNINGFANSGNALPNAFGAPLIVNGGGNNGQSPCGFPPAGPHS